MRFLNFLNDKLEEYLMVILVVIMTTAIFIQVVMRYCFGNSPAWTEELSRYIFLWAIWIGASYGVKTSSHVRLTILTSKLSASLQTIIGVIVYFIWLAFIIFLVVKGTELVLSFYKSGQISTALHLPMWIAYASVPVGCILMTFRMLQNGYFAVKKFNAEKKEAE